MKKEIQTPVQLLSRMRTSCAMLPRASCAVRVIETNEGRAVSIYSDREATPQDVAVATARLKAAFPHQNVPFFNILAERIIANGFTALRLEDAVNKVIDEFRYKELNISDVIGFDRRARLYTYPELCDMVSRGYSCDEFEIREIGDRKFWVQKKD